MKRSLLLVPIALVVVAALNVNAARITGSSNTAASSSSTTFDGGTISTAGITIPETTQGSDIGITIPALTAGRGPFMLDFGEHVFNGEKGPLWSWGYNTKWNGTVAVSGEPGFQFAIEGHYLTGGVRHIEFYSQYTWSDGSNYFRPFHYMIDKATHRITASTHIGNPFHILDDQGNSGLRVYPSHLYLDSKSNELGIVTSNSTLGLQFEGGVAATAGADTGFHFKTVGELATDNAGTDVLLSAGNGANLVLDLKPGGRLNVRSTINNGGPGFAAYNANGRGILLATGGGSGEQINLIGMGSGITQMAVGYNAGKTVIGNSATELEVDTTAVTVKSSLAFKHGTNTVVSKASVPGSASASCTVGQVAYDASYAYFCVATNTWARAALATW